MSEIQKSPFLAETFMLTEGFSKNALGSHFRIHKICSLEGGYVHVVFAGAKILAPQSSCRREHDVLFRRRALKAQLLPSTTELRACCAAADRCDGGLLLGFGWFFF